MQLCSELFRTVRGDLSIADYLTLAGKPIADGYLVSIIMNNVGPTYEMTMSSAQACYKPITYYDLEALLLSV